MTCKSIYELDEYSEWEIPPDCAIPVSDSNVRYLPFYGGQRASLLLQGPRRRWTGFVTMTDRLQCNVSLTSQVRKGYLIQSTRDQRFTLWLAVKNCSTDKVVPIRTIRWSVKVELRREDFAATGQSAADTDSLHARDNELVYTIGPERQAMPTVLLDNIDIPAQCLGRPTLSDIQRLTWYLSPSSIRHTTMVNTSTQSAPVE